jgi:N-formylglutamate amidohydrolase
LTAPDDGSLTAIEHARSPAEPWHIQWPRPQTAPLVFASPHSGRVYPPEFLAASRLDTLKLRLSEDAYMDEVFADAPDFGAPLLCARFPRAYVDVNREAYELDPAMFADPLPDYVNTSSPRIAAGLGTIARVVTDGEDIYQGPLRFEDARQRIDAMYRPYHAALRELLETTKRRFGGCLLIDCHSMPSGVGGGNGGRRIDVVLGDCFGTTCAAALTDIVQRELQAMDFIVTRNSPYAGGFTTRHYGRPKNGIHALQIEINRAIYMNEAHVQRGAGMPELRRRIGRLMQALSVIDPDILKAH